MKDSNISKTENEVKNVVVFPDRFLVWDKDAYELILHTEILWIQASRILDEDGKKTGGG